MQKQVYPFAVIPLKSREYYKIDDNQGVIKTILDVIRNNNQG